MKMKLYSFSINGEDWEGECSSLSEAKGECVLYYELQKGDRYYIGECQKIKITPDDIASECILENLANDIDAPEESSLNTLSKEEYDELSEIICKDINKYLKKIGRTDIGYYVTNVREFTA